MTRDTWRTWRGVAALTLAWAMAMGHGGGALAQTAGAATGEATAGGVGGGVAGGVGAEVEEATKRGVAYLLSQQRPDGQINDRKEGGRNDTVMTALSVLALASVGHQPVDPTTEGAAMARAVGFLLRPDRQDREGYFGQADGSRMYGHGVVTLALAEMLGMGLDEKQDQLVRDRLSKAVDLILRAQRQRKERDYEGGWRYAPDARDADLSVTVWQVMALRAAQNAGMEVPKEAIDKSVEYLRRSFAGQSRGKGEPVGAFTYQPRRNDPTYSTASEGLLAMQVCGRYEDPEVVGTANWLRRTGMPGDHEWYYYGTYYYAQGMYQRGGEFASEAQQRVVKSVLGRQDRREGSWNGRSQEQAAGKVYCTAMAMMSLSVRFHLLPIYQR